MSVGYTIFLMLDQNGNVLKQQLRLGSYQPTSRSNDIAANMVRNQVRRELFYHVNDSGLAGAVCETARYCPVEGCDARRGDNLTRGGYIFLLVARIK